MSNEVGRVKRDLRYFPGPRSTPPREPSVTAKAGADVLLSCSNLIARPIPFIVVVRPTKHVCGH